MRGRSTRSILTLVLVLAAAAAAAATGGQRPAAPERDAADSLHRAQLEQELIMAEGTATMYGELEQALQQMHRTEATR